MIVRTVQMISRAQVALAPLAVLTQMLIASSPPNKKHLTPLIHEDANLMHHEDYTTCTYRLIKGLAKVLLKFEAACNGEQHEHSAKFHLLWRNIATAA